MPVLKESLLDAMRGRPHVGILVVDEYKKDVPAFVREAQAEVLTALHDRPAWAFTNNERPLRGDLPLPPGTPVIDKLKANAFIHTRLRDKIVAAGVTDLVVMGYHRDACVAATIGHLWKPTPEVEDYGAVNFGFTVHTHLHLVHGGSLSKRGDRPLWYAVVRLPEIPEGNRLCIYTML